MQRTAHWQRQRPSPRINKKNVKNRICAAALPAHTQCSYSCTFDLWRVRLVVRTQPSQGWCTGSTPVRAVNAFHRRITPDRKILLATKIPFWLSKRLAEVGITIRKNGSTLSSSSQPNQES